MALDKKYTTTTANAGERTCLMLGWIVQAVFIGPDHASLAERCAEMLNADGEVAEDVIQEAEVQV